MNYRQRYMLGVSTGLFSLFLGMSLSFQNCSLSKNNPLDISTGQQNSNSTGSGILINVSVSNTNGGSGSVTDDKGIINCSSSSGTQCSNRFAVGQTVTLVASPAQGSILAYWSGNYCSGSTNLTCSFTVGATGDVVAHFVSSGSGGGNPSTFVVTVNLDTSARGSVASSDQKINCSASVNNCTVSYNSGASLTLTATPTQGMQFQNWTGAQSCSTSPSCSLTVSSNLNPVAHFAPLGSGTTSTTTTTVSTSSTSSTTTTLSSTTTTTLVEHAVQPTLSSIMTGGNNNHTLTINGNNFNVETKVHLRFQQTAEQLSNSQWPVQDALLTGGSVINGDGTQIVINLDNLVGKTGDGGTALNIPADLQALDRAGGLFITVANPYIAGVSESSNFVWPPVRVANPTLALNGGNPFFGGADPSDASAQFPCVIWMQGNNFGDDSSGASIVGARFWKSDSNTTSAPDFSASATDSDVVSFFTTDSATGSQSLHLTVPTSLRAAYRTGPVSFQLVGPGSAGPIYRMPTAQPYCN